MRAIMMEGWTLARRRCIGILFPPNNDGDSVPALNKAFAGSLFEMRLIMSWSADESFKCMR